MLLADTPAWIDARSTIRRFCPPRDCGDGRVGGWLSIAWATMSPPTADASAVFSSSLLHVAFEETISEADARALADRLGYAVAGSDFTAPRVVGYEGSDATANRLRELGRQPGVAAVTVVDWRAAARAAAEGAPPVDGICVMRIGRKNKVEVEFQSGTPESVALALVEQAGVDDGEWEPSPQTLTLRVGTVDEAAGRLEASEGVRWTARSLQVASAETLPYDT